MSFEFWWICYIILFGFIYVLNGKNNTNTSDVYNVRKNNVFDYNFDDWEESTQSVYFYSDFSNTDTTTTTTTITIETTTGITTTTERTPPPTVPYGMESTPTDLGTTDIVSPDIEPTGDTPTDAEPTEDTATELETITASEDTATELITDTVTNATDAMTDTDVTTTESTLVTTTVTITTPSTTTLNDTDLDELLHNYLTTEHGAELLITENTHYENTTDVTPGNTTPHPIVLEVKSLTETLKLGFFSTTLITLCRVVASKDEAELKPLLNALNTETMRLNAADRFRMFGPVGIYAIAAVAEMIALSPPDLVQSQASLLNFVITTRKTSMNAEMNAIFDLVDNIYTEDDAVNVIQCIVDIENFPEPPKTEQQICKELFEAVLFVPYARISGTHKEKLLMAEIENVVSKAIDPSQAGVGRRKGVHAFIPMKNYFGGLQGQSRKHLRKPLRTGVAPRKSKQQNIRFVPTTEFVVTDLSYFKNASIYRMLKRKQKRYKEKWKRIRESERIVGTKRGKTTTTTTTTTTIKPTMHRSKYYWRKYRLRNLYRMKSTTPSTTTTKLYPWMRRRYDEVKIKTEEEISRSKDSSCSTDETSEDSDDITRYNTQIEDEDTTISFKYKEMQERPFKHSSIRYEDGKYKKHEESARNKDSSCFEDSMTDSSHEHERTSISSINMEKEKSFTFDESSRKNYRRQFYDRVDNTDKHIKYESTVQKPIIALHEALMKSAQRSNGGNVKKSRLRKIIDNSDYSSEEKYLKANVLDALVHGRERGLDVYKDKRRHIGKKVSFDSCSNEEAILKANMYKAFGYSNNFAERLKKNL